MRLYFPFQYFSIFSIPFDHEKILSLVTSFDPLRSVMYLITSTKGIGYVMILVPVILKIHYSCWGNRICPIHLSMCVRTHWTKCSPTGRGGVFSHARQKNRVPFTEVWFKNLVCTPSWNWQENERFTNMQVVWFYILYINFHALWQENWISMTRNI